MVKKILTLVLVLSMLIVPSAAAATLTDVAGNKYEQEISLLNALGIVEGKADGAFMPEDALTRAEMVTIVLRLMNVTGMQAATFEDVPADHWASKNIGTAFSMGIVNGVNTTHFAPEDKLTYPQAVKMIVCALGFEAHAQAAGGYPNGYMTIANQKGVLKGTKDPGTEINRALMAKLVANALEIPIAVRESFGEDLSYKEDKNVTLLSQNLKVQKVTGQITANELTAIQGAKAKEGFVVLDGDADDKVFAVGTTNAKDCIGQTVTVYVRANEEDVLTILFVEAKGKQESLVLDASIIQPGSTTTLIRYLQDGKEEEVVVDPVSWIVNGDAKSASDADLKFEMGTVELIMPNGEVAKTVRITQYKNLIVDKVLPEQNKIYFKNANAEGEVSYELTEDNFDAITMASVNGDELTIDAIAEWDVLSVCEGKKSIEIIRSGQKLNGKVVEMTSKTVKVNGTDITVADEVVIGEETFKVAYNVARGIESGEIGEIAVGTEAEFLLDYTGKIAGFDQDAYRDMIYGWIVNAYTPEKMDAETQVRLFDENGTMKLYTLADNFLYNGTKKEEISLAATPELYYTEADKQAVDNLYAGVEAPAQIEYPFTLGQFQGQLVTFKAEDGKIQILDTMGADDRVAWSITGYDTAEKLSGKFTDIYTNREAGQFGPPMRRWDSRYILREKTKVFSVPQEYNGNDAEYKMIDGMTMPHTSDRKYTMVSLYQRDENHVLGAIVTHPPVGSASLSGNAGVITKISKIVDEEGSVLTSIRVWSATGEKTIKADEENVRVYKGFKKDVTQDTKSKPVRYDTTGELEISNLEIGDIIRWAEPNAQNVTTLIHVLHQVSNPVEGRWSFRDATASDAVATESDYELAVFTFAEIDEVKKHTLDVTIKSFTYDKDGGVVPKESFAMIICDDTNQRLLFDKETNTVRKVEMAEILDTDTVFSFRSNLSERLVVVYRD